MAGRAVGVLLAVAALLAAATARAADDDDKTQPWQCFKSCARGCHHHHDNGASALADFLSGVTGECKNISCHNEACFKDLPAITYPQCAIATCLGHPHRTCTVKRPIKTIEKAARDTILYYIVWLSD